MEIIGEGQLGFLIYVIRKQTLGNIVIPRARETVKEEHD